MSPFLNQIEEIFLNVLKIFNYFYLFTKVSKYEDDKLSEG
jgi:hypothetical protein